MKKRSCLFLALLLVCSWSLSIIRLSLDIDGPVLEATNKLGLQQLQFNYIFAYLFF